MKLDNSKKLLFYKILETVIFLAIFVWAIALLAENVLPGFISTHLSFLKLTLFTSFLLIIMSTLGRNLELKKKLKIKKWPLLVLAILGFVIISLSLIKFNYFEIFITTVTSLFIISYFYKVLFKE